MESPIMAFVLVEVSISGSYSVVPSVSPLFFIYSNKHLICLLAVFTCCRQDQALWISHIFTGFIVARRRTVAERINLAV